MFKRIFKSLCLLFCFTTPALAATGDLFVVTSTGTGNNVNITICLNINGSNTLGCQNYTTSAGTLTLSTTVPNKTYKYAGIRINTPGYIFTSAGLKKNVVPLGTGTTSTGFAADFSALPLLSPAPTTTGLVISTPFTVTTVYSSQNPSTTGTLIKLSANVSSGSGTPTGTVSFASGGTTIVCDAVKLSAGTATCSTKALSTATNSIVATYTPATTAFRASISATFKQYVVAALNPDGGTLVPAAPTQVSAVPGNGQVTVSWFPPANTGGKTINKYQVTCYNNNGGASVYSGTTTGLAHNITSLTNLTAYYCTVAASSNNGDNYGPFAYSSVVTPTSGLSASPANLALSVKQTAINAALTGNPRTITLTNTSDATISGINIAYPVAWKGGKEPFAYSTCGSSLNAGSSCAIIVTPGTAATSTCTTGIAPTPDTISVTNTSSASNLTINVVVLGYGCQYQGGYVFSVNDTTIPIGSVSGTVATIADQAAPYPSGVSWSPADDIGIWGIDELSTIAVPAPNASSIEAATIGPGQLNCDGNTDGSCDTNNIYTQYSTVTKSSYATGLCKQPIDSSGGICSVGSNCYSDWYLPSICEMGYYNPTDESGDAGCGSSTTPTLQNIQTSLIDLSKFASLAGFYWSSTEYADGLQNNAWFQCYNGRYCVGSYQDNKYAQFSLLGVRCSRALTI